MGSTRCCLRRWLYERTDSAQPHRVSGLDADRRSGNQTRTDGVLRRQHDPGDDGAWVQGVGGADCDLAGHRANARPRGTRRSCWPRAPRCWKLPKRPDACRHAGGPRSCPEKLQNERLRLLYVALTRAEKWLIVAAAGDDGRAGRQLVPHDRARHARGRRRELAPEHWRGRIAVAERATGTGLPLIESRPGKRKP